MKNTIKTNKTSYPTWNFLKVNERVLRDVSLPSLKPYSAVIENKDDVKIINMLSENLDKYKGYLDYKIDFGVSREIVTYTEENSNSGNIIVVDENVKASPVKISYKLDETNEGVADINIVIAGENSSVTVVIDYSSDENVNGFHSGITKVFAGKGSKVKVIKLQRLNEKSLHFDSNIAVVDEGASVKWVNAEIGASINITNYKSYLNGYKSDSSLYSGYFLDGDRIQDIYHSMIHVGEKSTSIMDVKGIVKDSPEKTYKGVVDFRKGSKGSKGEQSEDVTLLNKGIKVDSVPMLLSGEDNVEGAHAASLGQVNGNMIFYLMSRGLSERDAKLLLVKAKFNTVLNEVDDEKLVSDINDDIERRLGVYGI